ncbi:acyl-CoA dehydrogenase family protein [Novosphingobium sp. KCTC 2891]|uniref:acyl-CoA dehydrogenase family protein n=1 Tax=Novosphingobium sp. KCTC 2891 TaxID=2989730 RepID=UPI002221F218|nr:acyl-CoA dehydrogenase family protein [Novosphingobium sp. KCTC 2891]MCW1382944.1 acyl-CoA dehydrogenase family protein [Novosphingobium sp. KCTC 2891]
MNFQLSEEQNLLREALAGYLARRYTFDERRAALAGAGWRPEVWADLASEIGLFGAAIPEADGGLGGGPVEVMVIAEELGRVLALEPYVEAIVVAGALLRGNGDAVLLADIVAGHAVVVPALQEASSRFNPARIDCRHEAGAISGTKAAVVAAPFATHLLLSARDDRGVGLYIVESAAAGVERRDYRLVDGRPAADIVLHAAPARRIGPVDCDALALIERALDEGAAALCSEAVGIMATLLARTVDYARQREQFGRPIGTFQALQHRMADMAVAIERSRSMVYMATLSLALPAGERARAVSAAKAYVADALKLVAESAVQIHGGIGTTDEIDVSHYFKRAFVLQNYFGTAQYHLGRMAALS